MKPIAIRPVSQLAPDLCVVGAGRAGLAVASAAAALGVPTVIVDRDPLETALPRAGDITDRILDAAPPGLGWTTIRTQARAAAEARAPSMAAAHLRALGTRVVHGPACFVDPATIEAGGFSLRARRFILAPGALPLVPWIPGLDRVPWTSADRWLDLPELPSSVIVLGAGRTGTRLAQSLRRLGSAVTLIDGATPLSGFDRELATPVLRRLRLDGIDLRGATTVLGAEPDAMGLRLAVRDEAGGETTLHAERLILAVGRRPSIDGLRLDRAGIRCEPGGISVRPDGRTSNPRVFALGDVVGLGRSVEAAEAQAGVVLRAALFRLRTAFDPRSVPRILRTDPEIATVGLTEVEARGRFGTIRVWRWPYAETDHAAPEAPGHIKVLTTTGGRILGVGIVGAGASEAIGLWTLALAQGLKLADIASAPLPVGSAAELARRVAVQASVADLKAAWLRSVLKAVRRLG